MITFYLPKSTQIVLKAAKDDGYAVSLSLTVTLQHFAANNGVNWAKSGRSDFTTSAKPSSSRFI
jgi:hypothetical protein